MPNNELSNIIIEIVSIIIEIVSSFKLSDDYKVIRKLYIKLSDSNI
jgi:hypothetical protein